MAPICRTSGLQGLPDGKCHSDLSNRKFEIGGGHGGAGPGHLGQDNLLENLSRLGQLGVGYGLRLGLRPGDGTDMAAQLLHGLDHVGVCRRPVPIVIALGLRQQRVGSAKHTGVGG